MGRQWAHARESDAKHTTLQRVDVLGWTQHGAIVIATEEGWLPMTEPAYVRISELVLVQ